MFGNRDHQGLKPMSDYAMIQPMKYSKIETYLAPFRKLAETVPGSQIQGAKVAGIMLLKLEKQAHTMASMQERIDLLSKELFGKRKNKSDPEETVSDQSPDSEEKKSVREQEKAAKKKLGKVRIQGKAKPKGCVKRQTVRRRVPEGLFCNACNGRVFDTGLGHKAPETDISRIKVIEREYLLHRAVCQCGEADFEMPRPIRPLERSTYTSAFISRLIVSKFKFHLPVYRQQKQLLDSGIFVNRNVLNELILKSWKQLAPVVRRLRKIARKLKIRYLDETPICRVSGKKSLRYYLWCLHTNQAIVFNLTDKRNQKLAKEFCGSGGTLMTDGLGIYCDKSVDGEHGNCLAHALQTFFRSYSSFPEESEQAIQYLIRVYELEREAREKDLSHADRLDLRQKETAPLMEEFFTFLESLNPPPRSSLGKARSYCLSRRKQLSLFLTNGALEPDNNRVESIFKDVKLGLKNYLFVQSDLGGEAMAGFYSLIATCELHHVNPEIYLTDILERISDGHPQSRLDELLPWNWQEAESPLKVDPDGPDYIEQEYPLELLMKIPKIAAQVHVGRIDRPEGLQAAPPVLSQ